MMDHLKKIGLHFFCTALICSANAQITDSSKHSLASITVISRNIRVSEKKHPYSISKLTKANILESGARTSPEALMGTSGVFIQKTNHGGGAAFVRGLTGNQNLILVDGIRLNNSITRYGPTQYLNTIDLFSIEEVEVAKGLGAIEYGSDAIGGVINVKTKGADYSEKRKISVNNRNKWILNQMEQTNRTEIGIANKNAAINGGISFKNYGDLVGGATVGKQIPTGYSEVDYDFKAKALISLHNEIIFSSQNTFQKQVPIYHKLLLENYQINQIDQQIHNLNYLKYKHSNGRRKWLSETILTASIQRAIENRSLQKKNSPLLRKEYDTVHTYGMNIEIISKPANFLTLNTGIDYYQDKVFSNTQEINTTDHSVQVKRGLYLNASNYQNLSIFCLQRFEFDKLSFVSGIRSNLFSIKMQDENLGKIILKPAALVGNWGFSYSLFKKSQVYCSFTTGYRAPNLDDMSSLGIVDFRYEVPSYQLKPETTFNSEIGYKYNAAKTSIQVAAYYMRMKDIIVREKLANEVINGYPVYTKTNNESAYITGIEWSFKQLILTNLILTANTSFTYGQNTSKNEPMRRIPPIFGHTKMEWRKGNWNLSFSHQYAGNQNRLAAGDIADNRIGPMGTAQFQVFNFDAGFNKESLGLNLSFINLTNTKYKTHGSGVYGMGRAISINCFWNFDFYK